MATKGLQMSFRAQRLKKMISNMENLDMKLLHSDLGEEAVQIIEERFDNSRDPQGKRWPGLKRAYIRNGILRPKNSPPLKFRDLYKSFSFEATAKDVRVGTPKDYAKFHTNFPTNNQRPRKKIPLREFFGFVQSKDINRLLDVVEDHIETAMNV